MALVCIGAVMNAIFYLFRLPNTKQRFSDPQAVGDCMSATVGAALKKIAVALLTDKKVIKTIGGIVIGIIIIVVMPIVAVVSVFNGSMDIDTDKLNQSIQENISAEQMENLQLINDTMTGRGYLSVFSVR